MTLLRIIVCEKRPICFEIDGKVLVMLQRNDHVIERWESELSSLTPVDLFENEPPQNVVILEPQLTEWRLPEDPFSRLIEYDGKPIRFSNYRFPMMKLLIERANGPVAYGDIAKAVFGHFVQKRILEKQVNPLNAFLKELQIPWQVRCKNEQMTLVQVIDGMKTDPSRL